MMASSMLRRGSMSYKLVVLGPGGVGKTSIVTRFLEGFFHEIYKPTVEDMYQHTLKMPSGTYHNVEIIDTSGSHCFPAMRELAIRSARGFLLVFSIDSAESFTQAIEIWDIIQSYRGDKVPVVFVGNKTDLELHRQVSSKMLNEIVLSRTCRYVETSAKSKDNVSDLFQMVLEFAEELENPPLPQVEAPRRMSRRLSSITNISLSVRRKSAGVITVKKAEEVDKKKKVIKGCNVT